MEEDKRYVIVNGTKYMFTDLKKLDKEKLSELQHEISYAITNICIKRSKFREEFCGKEDTPEYLSKERKYKLAMTRLNQGQAWISDLKKKLNVAEHEDREWWFFCFYKAAKNKCPKFLFNRIESLANERAGYKITIND